MGKRMKKLLSLALTTAMAAGVLAPMASSADVFAADKAQAAVQAKGTMPAKPVYPYRNVVYYGDWSIYSGQNQFSPSMIDGSCITHLNFAFMDVDDYGNLVLCDYDADFCNTSRVDQIGNKGVAEGSPAAGVITGMAVLRQKYPNMRIGISVGGWTRSGGFPRIGESDAAIENFAANITEFVHNTGFDFVDIDWEYPTAYRDPDPDGNGVNTDKGCHGSEVDTVNFTKMMRALREHLDAQSIEDGKYYELSCAMSASPKMMDAIEYKEVIQIVDFANMMTYDLNGAWNNYTGHQTGLYINKDAWNEQNSEAMPDGIFSIDTCIQKLVDMGLTDEELTKVVVGVAGYTRGWSKAAGGGLDPENPYLYAPAVGDVVGEDGKCTNGCFGYATFLKSHAGGLTKYYDNKAKAVYYTNGNYFYTLDDPQTVAWKGEYVKGNGDPAMGCTKKLGGLIMWMASQDRDQVLTRAMKESLYGSAKIPEQPIVVPYPNISVDVIGVGSEYTIIITNNEEMTYEKKQDMPIDASPNASYYGELFAKSAYFPRIYVDTKNNATLTAGTGCKSGKDDRGTYFTPNDTWTGTFILPGKSYTMTLKCSGEADEENVTGVYMTETFNNDTTLGTIRGRSVYDPETAAATKIHVNLPDFDSKKTYNKGDLTAIGKHVYEAQVDNAQTWAPPTETIWKLLTNYINDGPLPTGEPTPTVTPTVIPQFSVAISASTTTPDPGQKIKVISVPKNNQGQVTYTYSIEDAVTGKCAVVRSSTAVSTFITIYSNPVIVTVNAVDNAGKKASDTTVINPKGSTPVKQVVATPSFSLNSGTYTDTQYVTISCATNNATIRYTTDGTEPKETSSAYTGVLAVDKTMTVKAKAFRSDMDPSATATVSYTIKVSGAVEAKVWAENQSYAIGDVVSYGGKYWECIFPHTSNSAWKPGTVETLWKEYTGPVA